MKERILTGWSVQRWIQVVLGISLVVFSAFSNIGIGIFLGLYLAALGVFNLGCGSGSCYTGHPEINPSERDALHSTEVIFEELEIGKP